MTTAVSIPVTGNKRGRRTAREWRALIVKFSRSCETRTQFYERHGLAAREPVSCEGCHRSHAARRR